MEAKIKGTPFKVDVQPHYDFGQFTGFVDTETHSLLYNSEDLEFEKEFDWDAYCREVAKDILAGMVSNKVYHAHPNDNIEEELEAQKHAVYTAIIYADELVRQLKEEE